MKIIILFLSCFYAGLVIADATIITPPSSIAKWYKPQNKRQVWLHNMFQLRRARHAVGDYAMANNNKLLNKWLEKYQKSYLKISQMVPEFKDEVDLKLLQKLKQAAADKDYNAVSSTLRQLDKTCNSCHNDYRATTVLLYRSADFKSHKIKTKNGDIGYKKYMLELTHTINRIKIAVADDLPQNAKAQIKELNQGIANLSKDCDTCHKQKPQADDYFNQTIKNKIAKLQIHLKENNKKDLNKTLGYIAVNACAICHGTHRISYDIKQQILNR